MAMYVEEVRPNADDEIIMTSWTDSAGFRMSVFACPCKRDYRQYRDDYLGKTVNSGYTVRVFGADSSMFYFVDRDIAKQKKQTNGYIDDLISWDIVFNTDYSLNKMRTRKNTPGDDISDILSLAEKYYDVSSSAVDEVFQSHEVENSPRFVYGIDSLRLIISSNFKVHKSGDNIRFPFVVDVLVDENGEAGFLGIKKSSNDSEMDDEARRIAELICSYGFIPAFHRDENVKCVYPVVFLKTDVL